MNQDNDNKIPTLIIIRGIPGSGKSFIAEKLVSQLNTNNVVLLDPDRIDFNSNEYKSFTEELKANDVNSKLFPYRFLRNAAYETIDKHGLIIWTQAFTNQDILDRTIKNLVNHSSQNNSSLNVLVADVLIDKKTARERIDRRVEQGMNGVNHENFKRFIDDYSPFKDYGYDVLVLDGKRDAVSSVEAILSKIRAL